MRRMGITSKRVVSPHLQHAYSNHCGIAPTLEILSTTFCQPSLGRQAMEFGGFSGRRAYRDTRQLALRPRSPDQAKRGQSATAIFELRGVSICIDGRRPRTPSRHFPPSLGQKVVSRLENRRARVNCGLGVFLAFSVAFLAEISSVQLSLRSMVSACCVLL